MATKTVTITPSGRSFTSLPHSTLLESGLSAGIALPYRCSNGTCGDCRAVVKSGEARKIRFHDYALSDSEKRNGVVLLCSNQAVSDLEIEVIEASQPQDIPVQQLNTRVCHCDVAAKTLVLRLKIVRGKVLRFLAGQYAKVTVPNLEPVLLAIASCPCETGYLEFHLPHQLEQHWQEIESLRRSDRVAIEGPFGTFTIDNSSLPDRQHIFITESHGFAVIKPMIEHIIATELEPQCMLYWISSEPYQDNLCRSWSNAFDWFNYHAVADSDAVLQSLDAVTSALQKNVYLSLQNPSLDQIILHLKKNISNKIVTDELAESSGTFPKQP